MAVLAPDLDHPRPRSWDEEAAAAGFTLRPRSWDSPIAASQMRRLVGGSSTAHVFAGERCCLGPTSATAPPGHRAEKGLGLFFPELDNPRPRSRDEEEAAAVVSLRPSRLVLAGTALVFFEDAGEPCFRWPTSATAPPGHRGGMGLFFLDVDYPRPRSRDEEEAAVGVALRPRSWASRRLVRAGAACVLFEGGGEPCFRRPTSAPAPPGHRVPFRCRLWPEISAFVEAGGGGDGLLTGVVVEGTGASLSLSPEIEAVGGGRDGEVVMMQQVDAAAARCCMDGGWREWPAGMANVVYRFNVESFLQPQLGNLTRTRSWVSYLGCPMEQKVPDTCSLVSCTVCVEALHRFKYETAADAAGRKFPCRAAAPRRLRRVCRREGIWRPRTGAPVSGVLAKIVELGGVPTTNAPTPSRRMLPLRSWKEHHWNAGAGLSAGRIAALLDRHGPCVGLVWLCPWYYLFDAAENPERVYRGCGRDAGFMEHSKLHFRRFAGAHAVVCYAYRFTENPEEMHVLVLDNHTPAGPSRWVDSEEIHELYTLSVGEPLRPALPNLGDHAVVAYPRST
ncbi:hypothetical protein ACP4OV_017371 [Aristida adscensionis]